MKSCRKIGSKCIVHEVESVVLLQCLFVKLAAIIWCYYFGPSFSAGKAVKKSHIFQNAQVTANKMVHMTRSHFLDQFFIAFCVAGSFLF